MNAGLVAGLLEQPPRQMRHLARRTSLGPQRVACIERIDAHAVFLAEPHGKMPNMSLSRNEIDDIVAYIRSLGPAGVEPTVPKKPPDLPKNG